MPELKRFVPFTRETLEAADETFDCVDFDKSGVVSADELFDSFSQAYKDFDQDDAKALLKHYDGDGDGKLTYREFIKFLAEISEP